MPAPTSIFWHAYLLELMLAESATWQLLVGAASSQEARNSIYYPWCLVPSPTEKVLFVAPSDFNSDSFDIDSLDDELITQPLIDYFATQGIAISITAELSVYVSGSEWILNNGVDFYRLLLSEGEITVYEEDVAFSEVASTFDIGNLDDGIIDDALKSYLASQQVTVDEDATLTTVTTSYEWVLHNVRSNYRILRAGLYMLFYEINPSGLPPRAVISDDSDVSQYRRVQKTVGHFIGEGNTLSLVFDIPIPDATYILGPKETGYWFADKIGSIINEMLALAGRGEAVDAEGLGVSNLNVVAVEKVNGPFEIDPESFSWVETGEQPKHVWTVSFTVEHR